MEKIKLAVIMGGKSGEHAVSLKSGAGILKNLNYTDYAACPVVISQEGLWHCGSAYTEFGPDHAFDAAAFLTANPASTVGFPDFLSDSSTKPDVVFPIIHGKFGEDGTLQGVLEMHGLKYVGSKILGSSLAMHKRMTKEMYQHHKITTPNYSYYSRRQWRASASVIPGRVVEKLGLPLFIKTPDGGSSVGMGMAKTRDEVRSIAESLFEQADEVLFEQCIKGVEVSCGVLENENGEVEALLPTEIIPVSSAFFDYKAKYEKDASREITPARITPAHTEAVRKTAILAHNALNCRGLSRTDIIIANDTLYVLETNTLPGFTETSLLPQGARAVGISYPELLDRILRVALRD